MAVPNYHQQHVNCKYHSICKSSPSRGQNSKQRMRGFVEGKSFKVNCSTDGPKVVPLKVNNLASVPVGFQPVNIASSVSKSI